MISDVYWKASLISLIITLMENPPGSLLLPCLFEVFYSKAIQNEMMENIVHMMRFHLQEILDIMLRRKCEFPLASSLSVFLHNIAQDNDLLINTFNYVTNILNNPEHGMNSLIS